MFFSVRNFLVLIFARLIKIVQNSLYVIELIYTIIMILMILIEHSKIGIIIYLSLAQVSNAGDFGEVDVFVVWLFDGSRGWEDRLR